MGGQSGWARADYKSQAALRAQAVGVTEAGLQVPGRLACVGGAGRRVRLRQRQRQRGQAPGRAAVGARRAMPGPGARADEGGGGEGAGLGREPARLCGYLQKLSGKGPLRGYRNRWFVFDARRCYLYYFKSPQDALPLGHLDIADACFSYQGPDEAAEPGAEPPAHFQVHSGGAVTVLKVGARTLEPAPQPAPQKHPLGPHPRPAPQPRTTPAPWLTPSPT